MIDYSELDSFSDQELKDFIERATVEKHKSDKKQHAVKILLNSLYGALGTNHFRLYNVKCAEAITKTGQTITAEAFSLFNDYLDKVTGIPKDRIGFSDTDSAAVDMTDLVYKFHKRDDPFEDKLNTITKLCDKHFAKMLDDRFIQFAGHLNSMKNRIVMKREKIASAILVAKKNYVVNVYDNEGVRYATPKLSVTGLESVKASTPKFFRKKLEEGYKLCFDDDEEKIHKFVLSVHEELYNLHIDDLAGNTTVNNITLFQDGLGGYRTGTPGHVRAAIAYNNLVSASDQYQKINNGDKVKIIQLKEPNPVKSKSICWIDKFPDDLIDPKYIDREKDYQKFFIKPFTRVLDVLSWHTEYQPNLDDLFC